ncbi:MAG: L-seryl-tRNA(Sec) selenium transferase [Deltaproteobacteria bacterium]|nr:L-seryl-tRNA(Sec) selenium transferase [Deltaproteobacteria bacterium]
MNIGIAVCVDLCFPSMIDFYMPKEQLRGIPSVDEILRSLGLKQYWGFYSKDLVIQAVRDILGKMRTDIIAGHRMDTSRDKIEMLVKQYLENMLKPSLKRMVNASGIVLHTNLGRAALCNEAIEAVKIAAGNPVSLEFDLEKGERGDRDSHIEAVVCHLTGAEAAAIVNNNAAAVFLTLNTLAEGKEVIISRGELIEIGGSFRIPDVIKKSGCKLLEVGTTNRTHPEDYISAINQDTAVFLKAHTSNYRVIGFTSNVDLKELVRIGRQYNIPVVEDLGSGLLVDISQFGFPVKTGEPVVRESLADGADIVTFSGDKLLGGPQAGIIAGKREYIQRINKNPLKRVLRVDKLTIAAMEATLRLYLQPDTLHKRLPTLRILTRPVSDIETVAKVAARLLKERLGKGYIVGIEDGFSQIGSGSLPIEVIATKVVSIAHNTLPPEKIFKMFLKNIPPVLGRVHKGKFLLDMRMIEKAEEVVI